MEPQTKNKQIYSSTAKNCVDFSRTYQWFAQEFTKNLATSGHEFWNINLNFYLLSISETSSSFWKGNDYFVTQATVAKDIECLIRISDTAVNLLLDQALGASCESKKSFKLSAITELEARIITAYNDFIQKKLQSLFIGKKEMKNLTLPENLEKLHHFVFYVYSDEAKDYEAGKIILSIPRHIIVPAEVLPLPEETTNISRYNNTKTDVDIFVGSTKISLEDLRNLEKEDIIILDNSNIHKLKAVGEFKFDIKVNPNPTLVINVKNEEGGNSKVNEEITTKKDLWDNIQIEVGAEFEKIKLSLGELRQISEGLVIDLASVYKNEITLIVENSPIAKGELVIIGDRYGVKLTTVFNPVEESQQAENDTTSDEDVQNADIESEESSENSSVGDEEFDYSDFEIEDDI